MDKIEKAKNDLLAATTELAFASREKGMRAAELVIANKELLFQNQEKEKRAAELVIANRELAYQNLEKEIRAKELTAANKKLHVQNEEMEKRAAELVIANTELAYQNTEKENRAAELAIANKELIFQNEEKGKREVERIKITTDLIQRNRDLEQFTFIISHNLRAPTANIMGYAENIQDVLTTPEERTELLKGLSRSVISLDSVIKDINTILQVKREAGERKESIHFSKLVNDVLASIGNLVDKHYVRIETNFQEADEIFSLKGYMYSIFYNLISNSIKYGNPNVPPFIQIKSKKENEKIIISFKDNGLGFDMKTKADKVFGLYKRFHTHVEGKGMGLFMVKTQVETMGGRISVKSEPGAGTEFTIEFENLTIK